MPSSSNNNESPSSPMPATYFIPSEAQVLGVLQEKVSELQHKQNDEAYHRLLNRFRTNKGIDFVGENINDKVDNNDLNFAACVDERGLLDRDKFSHVVSETLKALGITDPSLLAQIQVLPFAQFITAHFALEALRLEFETRYPNATNDDLASFLDESSPYFRTHELIKQAFNFSARPKYYHEDLSNQRQLINGLYLYGGSNTVKRKTDDERLKEVQNAYNEFRDLDERGYAPGTYWVAALQNQYAIYRQNERILSSDDKHFKNAIDNNYEPSQLVLLEEYIKFAKNNEELPHIYRVHEKKLDEWLVKFYEASNPRILSLVASKESDITVFRSENARHIAQILADKKRQAPDLKREMSTFSKQMTVKAFYQRFHSLNVMIRELKKILHDAPSEILLQLDKIERISLPNRGIKELFEFTNNASNPSQEEIELLEGVCRELSRLLKDTIRGQEAVPSTYITALEDDPSFDDNENKTSYRDAVQPLKNESPAHFEILAQESRDVGRALFGPIGGLHGLMWGSLAGTMLVPGPGTIVGGVVGAIVGALTTSWLGSKILPPITRWLTKHIEFYQDGHALGVKRAALVASMVGVVVGSLLGTILIPIAIPGVGALLGATAGVIVCGGISFGIAYIAERYFGAKHNTMHISAYGGYIGAVLGSIIGTITIPVLGTLIGAAAGSAIGAILTAATMWMYNSFRSPEGQEQDHQNLVTVVTAITGGSTTCSMTYNFLTPILTNLPYIGHIGAGAISIIAGFTGGGIWAYISRKLFDVAERETPINQDNSPSNIEEHLNAIGAGSTLASAAAYGIRSTMGTGAIYSPLSSTEITIDTTAGLVVSEVATAAAPVSGGILGFLQHFFLSPTPSRPKSEVNRNGDEKVVDLGNAHADFSSEQHFWEAATTQPSTNTANNQGLEKPLLRSRATHSRMGFHQAPYQWLFRPSIDSTNVSRFNLPSDDFITSLPHYQSHKNFDANGKKYIAITLDKGTTLQVRHNEIALVGSMPTNQAALKEVCGRLITELNWEGTAPNPKHSVSLSHTQVTSNHKTLPISFDKKNN
jgi:hypothetical protein